MRARLVALVVAALVLAAAGYGLWSLGRSQGMKMAAPAAPAQKKQVLYWHDPMVPGPRFDKPGKSPFMDMELVPVYDEGGADEGIAVSSRLQQNLGMRAAEVVEGDVTPKLEAVGSVAWNDRDVALVQARANGFLEKLYVRAPLDAVRKGDALAELYVPDWVAAQEEFLSIRRMQGAGTGALLDAARQRMRLAGMTDEQIRLVETEGAVHARVTIAAPITGVVGELAAREGMTVTAGTQLFRINGLSTVWVNAELPEGIASQVRVGQAVEARVAALADDRFAGRVGAVLPEVNAVTRTLKVRIEIANPTGRLAPGMFATIDFAPASKRTALLVPSEAVIQTGARSIVVLSEAGADGKPRFRPVDVETGVESQGMTEIRKGLERGQKVVASGQFLIDSEASLKAAATRLGEPAAAGAKP
ncbi:MAG: efflux RND transporter periplasmic adaptor subunit [Usitatibacter sp.]